MNWLKRHELSHWNLVRLPLCGQYTLYQMVSGIRVIFHSARIAC